MHPKWQRYQTQESHAHSNTMTEATMAEIQVDIVGEVAGAPTSHKCLIVVHELHSKWPEVRPSSHVTSADVISFLCNLFTRWGLSEVVITGNSPQFKSGEFRNFFTNKAITHSTTAFYHPQSNGGVERFNQILKQRVRTHREQGFSFQQTLQGRSCTIVHHDTL